MPTRRLLALLTLLASLLLPMTAWSWPHPSSSNVLVTLDSGMSALASDGAGGCFVAWSAYVDAVRSYDVFVQHYDASGAALWPSPVLACGAAAQQYVYSIVSDEQGGCIVEWAEYRNVGTTSTDTYAQRLSAAGTPLWTANGVAVCAATGVQITRRIAVGPAGVWFVWDDSRNFATTGYDIYAQLVSMAGVPLLTANGVPVCTVAGSQSAPEFAVDQNGGAVIVWGDQRSGTTDIYGQQIQSNGTATWAANGAVVCNAAGAQYTPFVQVVPGYSAIVAWTDGRGVDYDIYAQRISLSSGTSMWAANGLPVCAVAGSQSLSGTALDLNGNVVMAWAENRSGATNYDIYAQKVDLGGIMQWTSGGVLVRTGYTFANEVHVVSDQLGGAIVVWDDQRADSGDIYAQRLNASGSPMWTSGGVALCSSTNWQLTPQCCPGKPGAVIAEWQDYRSGSLWGAYIQATDQWGFLGAEPVMGGVKDIPNDQGGQVKVSWYASPLDYDPFFQNITDYIVYRSVPTRLVAQLTRAVPSKDGAVTLNGKRYVTLPNAAQDYFWEELAHVVPRHLSSYSYVAPTEGDSLGGSNPRTAFMVMAIGYYNSYWWASKADSGYSVDNIPPAAPAPLTGQYAVSGTALHWNRNAEPDLAGYRVYRGSSASFTPSAATLLTTVADTGYVAPGATPYFYKLSAIDTHGNESPVATLMPTGTLGVGDGVLRAEFSAPAPNPLRGDRGTTLRFALAVGGRTKLAIYDAQGRIVRALVEGAREAGAQAIEFDGRDASGRALAPGLYLARISAPGLNATRRLVVVK